MHFSKFRYLHDWRFSLIIAVILVCILLSSHFGSLKPFVQIDFFDVLGEGSSLLLTVFIILLVLTQRPRGKVSTLFYSGGLLLIFSMSLDLLDEFYSSSESFRLLSWLESLPQPVGLFILGLGMVEWRRENKVLLRQLMVREKNLRVHQWVDPLTMLYTKPYFIKLVEREITLHKSSAAEPTVLVSINFKKFALYNHQMGATAGDEFLHQVSELIILLLRPQDCLCREHSDQFLVLLPQTRLTQANVLINLIHQNLQDELPLPAYMRLEVRTHVVKEDSASQAIKALHNQVGEIPPYAPLAN